MKLELEDDFEDVLGSRAVLKKILRKGSGDRPRVGQLVTLKMQGRILSSTSSQPFLPTKTVCKRVGEKNFVSGIDLVLRLMFPGEKSIVRLTSRHGYGKEGCEELSVPADVNLEYEIELVCLGSLRVPPQQMSQQDLLSDCEDYQNKAKRQFSLKNYGESERLYVKALEFANALSEEEDSWIKIRCLNNIATVEFMLKKMKESKAACDSVLLLDSENAKALFRMGMVLETETEYIKSLQYFQRAMKSTDDETLRRRTIKAMRRVKKSREKYRAAKKKFSESMLRRRRDNDSSSKKDVSTSEMQDTTTTTTTATTKSKRAMPAAPLTTPIIVGSLIAALIVFGMYYI